MNSALPNSDLPRKLLSTWWDVFDHYVLAGMLAFSLAAFGLQTTQDYLICIPAVLCSAVAENHSVFSNGNASNNASNVCQSSVVLTKMADRRQYDFVENECYSKMPFFSKFFSLIFLMETVILLVISNLWHKYPNTACALAYCEHLLSEFNKGKFVTSEATNSPNEATTLDHKLQDFKKRYNDKMSVYVLYMVRVGLGIMVTIIFILLSVMFFSRIGSTDQCRLEDVVFITEYKYFRCSRSIRGNFDFLTKAFYVFLGTHFVLVCWALGWAICQFGRSRPSVTTENFAINTAAGRIFEFKNDAAFLFRVITLSDASFYKMAEAQKKKRGKSQERNHDSLL